MESQRCSSFRFQLCPMRETYCLLFQHHKRSTQPWKSYLFGYIHVIYLHDCGKDAENELESRKYELLNIIQDTQRGLVTLLINDPPLRRRW
ncbi:hypothetical protein HAX54_009719 [Datura stramonium]|uniref:Uncharacterized protein n=1 Tax=Datura stramonium TaxID=4076 RepID=A0ABS8TGZ4_DATST|nr:hypothetical protein [Datura stramonium]